jgi:hypothetical protein
VSKVKGSLVTVKVKKPKKVKDGMTMKAEAGEGDEASGSGSGSGSGDDEDKPKKGKKKDEKRASKKGQNPFRLVGYYGLPVRTPAQYNKIAYSAPETAAPTTLWSKDKVINSASLGLGFEAAIPLGKLALIPGARYRSFTPSLIDSDFNKGKLNPYVSTEEKATAIGAYVDVQYLRLNLAPIIAVNLLAGLDLDMSTVTVKATKKDDTPGIAAAEAASATSKLNVVSLRLGANMDVMALKVIGGRIGLGVMVPLAAFGASFNGKLAEDRALTTPGGDDLKQAIGHKKSSLGLELQVGGVLQP